MKSYNNVLLKMIIIALVMLSLIIIFFYLSESNKDNACKSIGYEKSVQTKNSNYCVKSGNLTEVVFANCGFKNCEVYIK